MDSKIDVIYDGSQKNLPEVPRNLLELNHLQMLYLENNAIECLPDDIFQKLPRLSWFDLRNNRLKEIPCGIANHECLETFLLENNKLEKIPNELGLCPNLLVLQLNGNPITYPEANILERGALAICEYLKQQFEKSHNVEEDTPLQCSEVSISTESTCPPEPTRVPSKRRMSIQELLRKASTAAKVFQRNTLVMTVKGLSPKNSNTEPKETEKRVEYSEEPDIKIKKKPTKICSKASINPHFNSNKYLTVKKPKPNKDRVVDQQVKEIWLSQLKQLLLEQEQLLQQEKNLQALNSWRLKKKAEPIKKVRHVKMEVPYDTDPEYDTMVQREDLCRQVDTMVRRKKRFHKPVDMNKMISEIILQLKALEAKSNKTSAQESDAKKDDYLDDPAKSAQESRAAELVKAEVEIRKIIDLHKKVTTLQTMNDTI